MIITESIPRNKFSQWYEIFRETDGRFLVNPSIHEEVVFIRYQIDTAGYNELARMWNLCNIQIVEKRRVSFFTKLINIFRK